MRLHAGPRQSLVGRGGQVLDEGRRHADRGNPEPGRDAEPMASSAYSMSSSTRVSTCSETKAIGAMTTPRPSAPARSIASGVEGPSHFIGPTRLW
jgi:hypothetical protein